MLCWIQGVSLTEHQTNVSIWKKAGVLDQPSHWKKQRLHWYGHVRRQGSNVATNIALNQTVPGAQHRGRPKLWYMDVMKQDMKNNGIDEAATHVSGQLPWQQLPALDGKPEGENER